MRDKVETGVQEKNPRLGEKMHRVNVRWPWLKVAGVVLLVAVTALCTVAALRQVDNGVGEVVVGEMEEMEEMEEVDGDVIDDEAKGAEETEVEETAEEVQKIEDPKPEGTKTEETKKEAPKVEAPAQVVVVPQNTGRKVVALTFDDGPSAATTGRLLDILAAKQVKVTFFVLGTMAQKSPALIQREVAEEHEVESHTMSHQNLNKLAGAAIQGEVAGADMVLQGITGSPAKLVRPPYGSVNATVRANIGKPMILWTVDPEDWKYRNAATVRANVVSKVFDGAIVLMHDIHSTTVDAVGAIIDDLRAAGYEFLTVSEMATERGVVMQNGVSYGSFRR